MDERMDAFRRMFSLVVDGTSLSPSENAGRRQGPDGWWTFLVDHRVLGSVADALARCDQSHYLPADLCALDARIEDVQHLLTEHLRRLVMLDPQMTADVVVLKGGAMQPWWPRGLRRSFIDIDLGVLSEAAFWRVCQSHGVGSGFQIPTVAGMYRGLRDEDWAFSCVFAGSAEPDGFRVVVELHHRFFLPSSYYALDLIPIIREATLEPEAPDLAQVPLPTPTRPACLRLLLAEISGRSLYLRDALDFQYLVFGNGETHSMAGEDVTWACADDLLLGQFHRLAALHRQVANRSLPVEIGEAAHLRARSLRMVALKRATDWFQLRDRLEQAYVWQRLRMSRPVRARRAQTMSGVVRLLHLGWEPCGPRQWAAGRDGTLFLITPIGTFLPTPSLMFSEEFVERAAAVARESMSALGESPQPG